MYVFTAALIETSELESLMDGRTQGAEIWEELGDWITANKPEFGPGTKERFQMCSKLTTAEV